MYTVAWKIVFVHRYCVDSLDYNIYIITRMGPITRTADELIRVTNRSIEAAIFCAKEV